MTDEQVLGHIYNGWEEASYPLHSINAMIQNFTPNHIERGVDFYMSGYVDLFPIRNLYITSQTLGTYSAIGLHGERGVLKQVPIRATYGELLFDQTVLGMDYLDCSHQSLSILDFLN